MNNKCVAITFVKENKSRAFFFDFFLKYILPKMLKRIATMLISPFEQL